MKRFGFSLIELLVVAAISFLIFSLGVLSINPQRKKINDARRRNDIHQLQVALEGYYYDHQKYPGQLTFNGQPLTSADGQTVYLSKVPADPLNRDPYLYTYWATPAAAPASYVVCAYAMQTVPGSFCLTNRQ